MKTAMQRHLEWLKARMIVTEQMEQELLELEKQQIIDAYDEGQEEGYQYDAETSEPYYNQTFKTKTYKLNMTLTVPIDAEENDILDKLVEFADENGYFIGGGLESEYKNK